MRQRILELMGVVAVIIVVSLVSVAGQAPTTTAQTAPAPKTSWGEPDFQGIWTDDYQTPLQRAAKYAGKDFLTDAEIAELDAQRATLPGRNFRAQPGSEQDVTGAYNAVFTSVKHTGRRTSLIVDPPDGRIPPTTQEAKKMRDAIREFQLALIQATASCKNKEPGCAGGTYGPPSPRRADPPPYYNTDRLNRVDGPEDRSLMERCMSGQLPDLGGFRQIVQSPGSVSILYDTGQGQGWQRVIPITSAPHLAANVRQWWGDSRGRWEGNTLVVDVANFSPKTDFRGSRENLHLIERWTRTGPNTLEYAVSIDDPTVWTKPRTVKHEMNKQSDQANRIYKEPRCHEGNYGMIGMLSNMRADEVAFTEGRGPDPATRNAFGGGFGLTGELTDPLGGGE